MRQMWVAGLTQREQGSRKGGREENVVLSIGWSKLSWTSSQLKRWVIYWASRSSLLTWVLVVFSNDDGFGRGIGSKSWFLQRIIIRRCPEQRKHILFGECVVECPLPSSIITSGSSALRAIVTCLRP